MPPSASQWVPAPPLVPQQRPGTFSVPVSGVVGGGGGASQRAGAPAFLGSPQGGTLGPTGGKTTRAEMLARAWVPPHGHGVPQGAPGGGAPGAGPGELYAGDPSARPDVTLRLATAGSLEGHDQLSAGVFPVWAACAAVLGLPPRPMCVCLHLPALCATAVWVGGGGSRLQVALPCKVSATCLLVCTTSPVPSPTASSTRGH